MIKNFILTAALLLTMVFAQAQMVLEYDGIEASDVITLPLAGTVNVTINWGDGTSTEAVNSTGNLNHTYTSAGDYTVEISGSLTGFGAYNYPNADKLTAVTSFGNLGITSLYCAFHNATNLTQVPTNIPATITNMECLFCNATVFNQDISAWDVSNVSNMRFLFSGATAFNQDISIWDVSNVTNMEGLFEHASSFNQDISTWDVSSVTNTGNMFFYATTFNQDISIWDVSNVKFMYFMFFYATTFNQNISAWNVSSVINMMSMFYDATAFNQDLSTWNVSSVTNMSDMFNGVTLSTENYDAILNAWSQLTLQSSVSFHAGNSQYTVCKQAAKDILTSAPNNWSITDGGSVADAINPTISCIANQTKDLEVGQTAYSVSGTELDPTATDDNCGVASVENDFNNSATLAGASIPVGTKNIVWTVTDNTGNIATCNFDVTVNANTTAIETLKQNGISVFPNPTTGILNFEFADNNIQKIKILNLSGKTVIERTNINKKETFNLQEFKSGVYIISIQTNKEVFKTKIMKN